MIIMANPSFFDSHVFKVLIGGVATRVVLDGGVVTESQRNGVFSGNLCFGAGYCELFTTV